MAIIAVPRRGGAVSKHRPGARPVIARLRQVGRDGGTVTLLFGAREETYNHAALPVEVLKKKP